MSEAPIRWHVYADPDVLVQAAVDAIAAEARHAISSSGSFLIVLSGGSTPRPIYARLADIETDWDRWHVYFSDERCLPAGHSERNDSMARETWLDRVPIARDRTHTIPAELGPDEGAAAYARTLAGVEMFDLTLLGLGADGHTASLFPDDPVGVAPDSPDAVPVVAAPEPYTSRVSLSAARLSRSHSVYVLVTGEEKREAVTGLRDGADTPIRVVNPINGIDLLLDNSAVPSGID